MTTTWRTNRRTRTRFQAKPEILISNPEARKETGEWLRERGYRGRFGRNPPKQAYFYNPVDNNIYVGKSGDEEGLPRNWVEDAMEHEFLHRYLQSIGVPPEEHHQIILRMLRGKAPGYDPRQVRVSN